MKNYFGAQPFKFDGPITLDEAIGRQAFVQATEEEMRKVTLGPYSGPISHTEAVKHDSGKPDHSLHPPIALEEIAKVWTFGQQKYAAFNWARGFAWRRPAAAAMRHIIAWLGG